MPERTLAENQQTVEAVLDWIDIVLSNSVRPNTQPARAALRDLVAQAELADDVRKQAEREELNRSLARSEEDWDSEVIHGYCGNQLRMLLARLDGAR